MKKEYLSAEFEPAHRQGRFEPDPSELRAAQLRLQTDDVASVRDSVRNEPAIHEGVDQWYLRDWIEQKRSQCSVWGNLGVAILAAALAGPFAILGAFMAGRQGWYGVLYVVVFAPVIEELLKQSGMIYLLEKKPYRVFAAWQFVFSAVVSAAIFATIENLLYIHLYVPSAVLLVAPAVFAKFRWTICTALHIACSGIASLGMIRVWRKQLADGKAADLTVAYPYFVAAIVVHGGYNLAATFFSGLFVR